MDFARVETAEISDDELDNVAGGIGDPPIKDDTSTALGLPV